MPPLPRHLGRRKPPNRALAEIGLLGAERGSRWRKRLVVGRHGCDNRGRARMLLSCAAFGRMSASWNTSSTSPGRHPQIAASYRV
jgi:hypothetical protein